MKKVGPKVAALFAGIGGLELGLERSGFRTVFACEIDKTARRVLRMRFPYARLWPDIRNLPDLPDTDVVTAGFPCQDLSQAGRTAGLEGPHSALVNEVFRLLGTADPEWVVLENVPFMLHLNRGTAMKFILRELQALQFRWAYRIVDTRSFGLPQRRRRVIIVASRRSDPRNVLLSDNAACGFQDKLGTAYGFYWTEGNTGLGWAIDGIPPLKRGSNFGIASPPAIWQPNQGVITPEIRDAERLQGFPPGWTSLGRERVPVGKRWHFLGNAVSVPVSRWLGRRLLHPRPYDADADVKLSRGARLPAAAWWMGDGVHISSVTEYPVSRKYQRLDTFLRFPPLPLSSSATAGFLHRARRSNLKFAPGFLEGLEAHLQGVKGYLP